MGYRADGVEGLGLMVNGSGFRDLSVGFKGGGGSGVSFRPLQGASGGSRRPLGCFGVDGFWFQGSGFRLEESGQDLLKPRFQSYGSL